MITGNAFQKRAVPTISGNETVEELRALVVQTVLDCSPCDQIDRKCPIRMLGGLTYNSLHSLVTGFSRGFCLELMENARECYHDHCHWTKPGYLHGPTMATARWEKI